MKHRVEFGPAYSMITVELDAGESVKAEPGAMVAQSNVQMRTGMPSGLMKGFRRMLGGESFFMNTFTAESGGGWVALAPSLPGDLGVLELQPEQPVHIQGSSFLGATVDVDVDTKFQGFRGILSGESLFFVRVEAQGSGELVFYNCYGAMKELAVAPGDELVVDTGHVVAFTAGVSYDIGKVGGLGSLVLGGEGLVMKFRGTGVVWVQTRALPALAARLQPFLKTKSD